MPLNDGNMLESFGSSIFERRQPTPCSIAVGNKKLVDVSKKESRVLILEGVLRKSTGIINSINLIIW